MPRVFLLGNCSSGILENYVRRKNEELARMPIIFPTNGGNIGFN